MAKAVKFLQTFFEVGIPKYEAGKAYPVTDETKRQVVLGHAEQVDVKADEVETGPAAAQQTESAPTNGQQA
jgi:hypothetical protein